MSQHLSIMSQAAAMEGQVGLQTMPLEILDYIASHLDYPSALQLAGASRALRHALHPRLISPEDNYPLHVHTKQLDLRFAETSFKKHMPNLACFTCMRILPREAFSASNRRGDRGKGTLLFDWTLDPSSWSHSYRPSPKTLRGDNGSWAKRFCWDCGIKHAKFPHMEGVRRYPKKGRSKQDRRQDAADPLNLARLARERTEEVWYLCHQCGEMKNKKNMCLPVPWVQLKEGEREERKTRGYPKMLCSGIFDDHLHKHDYRHQSAVSSPRSALSRLELLPQDVQFRIFTQLRYRDKIMLSQTSRHFAATVQPSSPIYYPFSLNDKYEFIRQCEETKWRLTTEHRKDDMACYGCFRMRPNAKFCDGQIRQTSNHDLIGNWRLPYHQSGFRQVEWRDALSHSLSDHVDHASIRYDYLPRKSRCNSCLAKMFRPGLAGERPVTHRSKSVVKNANRRETTVLEDEEAMKRLFLFSLQSLCLEYACARMETEDKMLVREVMRYIPEACSKSEMGIEGFECWGCVHRDERLEWVARELERLST